MDQNLPPLLVALLEAQRYADGVQRVELVQTHISWVLLAGDFAYKIKKPLKLPFLDFSTLELRHARCADELRLNSRFAPDIYLALVGIFNTPQDPRFDGPGPPIEYAVKMRRFDEAFKLDHLCARGELHAAHLSGLALALVAFHARAAVAPTASRFGAAHEILAQAQDNFVELKALLPAPEMQSRLAALQAWTGLQFERLAALMQARRADGWVRECHGDLHLGNLVLINGQVRLFDCIEFNESLRWIDVASEIAFTYVDLMAHAQPGLATWFVNEVLSRNGDYDAAPLLRFYAVYRALVRAKVAAIRSGPATHFDSEAMRYIALAQHLTEPPKPRLIITHGLSGCGKTWASSAIVQGDPSAATLRIRSDVERRRHFAMDGNTPSGSPTNGGIYTPQAHVRVYQHLREMAQGLLGAGWSVLVDASFLKRVDRASFQALAKQAGAVFSILAPQATPEQLRQRIQARQAQGLDPSEATLDVLEQQMRSIEPLQPDEIGLVWAGFAAHN